MSNANTTTPGQDNNAQNASDKGKGKETVQDVSMDEAGDDDEEDSSEDEVDETAPVADDVDEDNMEEIDVSNIITDGRRTRGRQIDFAKAAEQVPEDDDEEEDDDFVAPAEDKMEH